MQSVINVEEKQHASLKDSLQARLRQLPGGQFLPTKDKIINSLADATPTTPGTVASPESAASPEAVSSPQSISATLPDIKATHLIIGSGGLKAALRKASKPKDKNKSALRRHLESQNQPIDGVLKRSAREAFRKVYIELYPYYFDFAENSNDSKVFKDYKDPSEIAAVLQKLLLFDRARFLGRDTTDITSNLNSTIEWFESRLLGQFDAAYDKKDYEEMKINSHAAFYLNGGLGCVNVFISKNPVFFDHTFNPSLLESKLPSMLGPSMGYALADEFAKYMEHTLQNCKVQIEIVSKVFVPDVNAMTLFMDKVIEDSISEYLSAVVGTAKAKEGLSIYLHTLATAMFCCSQLINHICKNQYKVVVDKEQLQGKINEIFAPYLANYVELELELLKKRFKIEIDKWDHRKTNGKPVEEKKPKNQLVSSMKAIAMAPVNLTGKLFGGSIRKGASQPLLDADVFGEESMDNTDTVTYDVDDETMNGLVSVELAIHLLHQNKESLGRVLVVCANSDVSKLRPAVQKVFVLLLKTIGEKHLKPAFAMAIERLSKSAPIDFGEGTKLVNMDSLQFFDLIHVGDLVQQMIQGYYQEDIRMWIDEQDFLSDIIIEKKAFERLLDDSVAAGMDKAIQVLINQCEFLLISGHSLDDFNLGPDALVMDFKPTKACTQVMLCLETHTKVLKGSIEANTMEVFLSEVCVRLFQVIIKNIRRLKVSQTGAMQLICDFNKYYEWAYSLRLNAATKQFQALKELGNLFLADGSEELRSLVHDLPRFNGALRIEEIYELLQSRTDYEKVKSQVEAKECIIQ